MSDKNQLFEQELNKEKKMIEVLKTSDLDQSSIEAVLMRVHDEDKRARQLRQLEDH